jgi:methylmalonyl-CoA/ethylmalonyl-CoA epimerase
LNEALEHFRAQRCVVLGGPVPAVAFEGRKIAWLYTPARELIELVEAPR